MRLSEIQESFKSTMLDPAHLDVGNGAFRALFRSDAGISLDNRFKVYRNNIIRSLTDAAMAALPMTKKLVGEKFLDQAMRAYVVGNLPEEGNLNGYGRSFPDFIAAYEPAAHLPYLPDFTRLEWAWENAYYAADDSALDPAELSQIPPDDMPRLRLRLRQSCQLLRSAFALDEIVEFCRAYDEDDAPMSVLSTRGVDLMFLRPAMQVEIHRLTSGEYDFLTKLKAEMTIEKAAVTILESDANFNLTEIFEKHLNLGTFSGFEIE